MAELTREASDYRSSNTGGWYRHLARWLFPPDAAEPSSASEIRARIRHQLEAAEAALEAKRQRITELGQLMDRLDEERRDLELARQNQEQAIDAALSEDRENEARVALRECWSKRREVERISNRLRGVEAEKLELAALLEEQQVRLDALRRDVGEPFPARSTPSEPDPKESGANDPIDDEEVELEMLRRKRSLAKRPQDNTQPQDKEQPTHATDSV